MFGKKTFTVHALWDDDAKVFCSESNIIGLHIEADTLEQFEKIMDELAPELIIANHVTRAEQLRTNLSDLIPSFRYTPPAQELNHNAVA